MVRVIILASASLCSLSACTTVSFAPPPLAINYFAEGSTGSCPSQEGAATSVIVTRDVPGAFALTDAFITAYRCSAHAVANGRQAFEVPAFLVTTGTAAAVALGGGSTYGIAGTVANSLLGNGKAYYDPKAKAAIYDHALDALLCIKTVSVGADPLSVTEQGKKDLVRQLTERNENPTVTVSSDQQYFMLVSSADFSVERILAQRLSNMAPVDAEAVAAQLAKAIEAILKAEEEKKKKAEEEKKKAEGKQPAGSFRFDGENPADAAQREMVAIDLKILHGKLQECVVRAKL